MIEYTIIQARKQIQLINLVNEALQAGWTLQGGVSMAPATFETRGGRITDEITGWISSQAMIREIVQELK